MSHLYVGIGQVVLRFRHARSLKDKRQWIKSTEQKLRNAGFSVTEAGYADNPKQGVLGFSYVGDSHARVEKVLNDAFQLIGLEGEILDSGKDIFDYSEMREQSFLDKFIEDVDEY